MRTIRQEIEDAGRDEAAVGGFAGVATSSNLEHVEMAGLLLPPLGSMCFLNPDGLCENCALSIEQYLSWQHEIDLLGLAGLSGTHRRGIRTSSVH